MKNKIIITLIFLCSGEIFGAEEGFVKGQVTKWNSKAPNKADNHNNPHPGDLSYEKPRKEAVNPADEMWGADVFLPNPQGEAAQDEGKFAPNADDWQTPHGNDSPLVLALRTGNFQQANHELTGASVSEIVRSRTWMGVFQGIRQRLTKSHNMPLAQRIALLGSINASTEEEQEQYTYAYQQLCSFMGDLPTATIRELSKSRYPKE